MLWVKARFPSSRMFSFDHIFPSALSAAGQNLSVLARLCSCFSNTLPLDQYALGDFGIDRWRSATLVKFGCNFIDSLQG